MSTYEFEHRLNLQREKSREAISLAMESRWQEAVDVNRSITELFPDDVESNNRLAKALFELGDYLGARLAFSHSLELSPRNVIAKKNLARLDALDKQGHDFRRGTRISPRQFLDEAGKTVITMLEELPKENILALVAPGDSVLLAVDESHLIVQSDSSEYLGRVSGKLAVRLIRLIKGGNKYECAIIRASGSEIGIIIREVYRSASQLTITSFPGYLTEDVDISEEVFVPRYILQDRNGGDSNLDQDQDQDQDQDRLVDAGISSSKFAIGGSEPDPEDEDVD